MSGSSSHAEAPVPPRRRIDCDDLAEDVERLSIGTSLVNLTDRRRRWSAHHRRSLRAQRAKRQMRCRRNGVVFSRLPADPGRAMPVRRLIRASASWARQQPGDGPHGPPMAEAHLTSCPPCTWPKAIACRRARGMSGSFCSRCAGSEIFVRIPGIVERRCDRRRPKEARLERGGRIGPRASIGCPARWGASEWRDTGGGLAPMMAPMRSPLQRTVASPSAWVGFYWG